jgi:hypothetical protein
VLHGTRDSKTHSPPSLILLKQRAKQIIQLCTQQREGREGRDEQKLEARHGGGGRNQGGRYLEMFDGASPDLGDYMTRKLERSERGTDRTEGG